MLSLTAPFARFAQRAKTIKNKIKKNEIMDDKAQLTKYKKELAEMKARLAEAEARSGHLGHEGVEEMQDEIREEYEEKMAEIKEKEAQSGEKYKKIQAMFLRSVVSSTKHHGHHHVEVDNEGAYRVEVDRTPLAF